VSTVPARRCAWCGGRLSRTPGWIEVRSELYGRIIPICQPCWQGAERAQIIEALGNGTKSAAAKGRDLG